MDEPLSTYQMADEPEAIGEVGGFTIHIDETRNEVVVDEPVTGDFTGIITGMDTSRDLIDHSDEIFNAMLDMRELEDSLGGPVEKRLEFFETDPRGVPMDISYVFHKPSGDVGMRFTTEVDGSKYGFETLYTYPIREDIGIHMTQIDRQLKSLTEAIWEDFVANKTETNGD